MAEIMTTQKKNIHCPTCRKQGTWLPDNQFRPFCSERCKLIDLGEWADEKYRVPSKPADFNESTEDKEED